MLDVASRPRVQVVHAQNFVSVADQAVAQM